MKYALGGKVDQKVLDFSEKAALFLQKLGTNCTICPKFFLAPVGGALCEGGKSTESRFCCAAGFVHRSFGETFFEQVDSSRLLSERQFGKPPVRISRCV